jgi:hypothetical protein
MHRAPSAVYFLWTAVVALCGLALVTVYQDLAPSYCLVGHAASEIRRQAQVHRSWAPGALQSDVRRLMQQKKSVISLLLKGGGSSLPRMRDCRHPRWGNSVQHGQQRVLTK